LTSSLLSHAIVVRSKTNDSKAVKEVPQKTAVNSDLPHELWQEAEKLRAVQTRDSNQKAIEKYKTAADLWRSRNELELAAGAFRSVGEVFQILGDLKNAVASFNEALSLCKRSKSQTEESRVLNGLSYAHFLEGDGKQAKDESLVALDLATKLGDRKIEAQALSNLAESVFLLGDLANAQKHQLRAYALWSELGDLKGKALSQIALGYYNANLSEPRTALEFLQQALNSAQEANDVRGQALALNAKGNILAKLGRKQEAIEAFAKAQPLAERIGDRLYLASILGGTGGLYLRIGDAARALEYLEIATHTFEDIGASWGIAEGKLDVGRANCLLGNNERAIECFTEALAIFRTLGMKRLQAQTLERIGAVQISEGDLQKALNTLQQTLSLNRSGQDYRHEANALNLIGKVYEDLKEPARALQCYQQALVLSRTAADPTAESTSLFNLARHERDEGDLSNAEQKLESAIQIDESIRAQMIGQDLRASYFATIHQIYELYMDVLMLHNKINPNAGFDVRAFAVSERARSRSLLESLQETQVNVSEGVDPSLLEKERSLSDQLNAKADRQLKLHADRNTTDADNVNKEIDALTVEYAAIRDRIRATSPRYADLTLPEPLTLDAVQQHVLDDDSILLEYALGEDRSYVWLITRANVLSFELPPGTEIERAARVLYNQYIAYQPVHGESVEETEIRQKKAAEAIPAATASLSKMVLGPLVGKLQNKRLLIVADGALQYVPFQALNDPDSIPESPQPLVAKHEIVNEPSASTLAVLRAEAKGRRTAPNSIAVLADPVFEADDPRVRRAQRESTPESAESVRVKQALRDIGISADGVQIPRLLASREEADAIMKSAPWGTSLQAVGFEATRETVLGPELSRYRVVHFATHGMMNNEHPELSGIVLSLFDQDGRSQNGFLRLHDIYNLRLPADLVVLSACSTGLGKDVRGEGLIGLTRGFMYAGASGVVASLWKVDDQATAELMKDFYAGLFQKGLSPASALREAQLALARQNAWKSPYYWAGFVIQGRYDEQIGGKQWNYLTPARVVVFIAGLLTVSLTATFLLMRWRRLRSI